MIRATGSRWLTRVARGPGLALLLAAFATLADGAAAPGAAPDSEQPGPMQEIVKKGLRVQFSIEPAARGGGTEAPIREGEHAEIRFRVTDAATGTPVSPLEPAVWISRSQAVEELSCRERIGRYVQGMLSHQAEVDLNEYFILILNNDQSISVVDPLMGVGGITQLYAMTILEEPGEDWTRSADDKRLFVSMPRAGKVAVVDLESFRVVESVEAGTRPTRLALQPDGKYLWVTNEGTGEGESGVTVLDAGTLTTVAHVATGAGPHEIAFSEDSLVAFVTNGDAHSVSLIDVQRLDKIRDVDTGETPVTVQFSALSRAAYVASLDGTVSIVDAASGAVRAKIETGPGLAAFRLEPAGRWGFVANGRQNRVYVLDLSSGRVAHQLAVGPEPHQFAFTATYAYFRHLGSADVTLIPLAQLGNRATVGVQSVAFGSRPPGEYPYAAAADAIAPTGEWTAVVTANPADQMVYYYMEGMIAPMGSYSTYGRVPRAVAVVDRSVRETERGVYAAKFRVPASGDYDVAFLVDSPLVDHCFSFRSEADPVLADARDRSELQLEYLNPLRTLRVGEPLTVRFSLARPGNVEPAQSLGDVVVLATRPPGSWQERKRATPLDGGVYEATFAADQPGAYYVSVSVPSLGLGFTELPYRSFRVVAARASERGE